MAKTDKKDLEYLGQEFQYRLIHTFMSDKSFFKDLHSILDQNMFSDPNLRMYVGVMREYYETEEAVPSYDMMNILLREKSHNDIERETFEAVVDKIKKTESDGVDYIRDLATKFFKQQNIVKTANEILKIAGNGDIEKYEQCVELLNDALNKGSHDDMGSSVFDDLGETLSDDYRTPIPTGIGKLDEALEGGLGKGEMGVIVGPTSFGKSLWVDELVATPKGFVRIGDIRVGDFVMNRKGQPTKVLGVFPQGKRDLYKVGFSDGVSCICDMEHLWAVNSYYQRCGKKWSSRRKKKVYRPDNTYKVKTLREIVEDGLFRSHGRRHNYKVPMPKATHFNKKVLHVNPYLLGLMLGDGNFKSLVMTVDNQDIDNIDVNLKDCGFDYTVSTVTIDDNTKSYIKINKEFGKSLSEYYSLDISNDSKYIHSDFLYNSIKNRVELLNGLMDSDGTCSKNGYSSYSTKSKRLAEEVKQLVLSLGGFAKVREKNASYFNENLNQVVNCGLHYEVVITLCDKKYPIFKLKRKQDRVVYRDKKKGERFIDSVEFAFNDDAVCILVEDKEHLFLTKDFIVTHNTSLTTAMASFAATYKCPQNNDMGYKVLQIVFEDRIKQIQRKHIGRITGIEAKDISKKENIEMVKEQLLKYPDREMLQRNLRIVRFPSGELTANAIKRFIKKLENNGFKPDMVIVDYFECLAHERSSASSNEYENEGKTMRKFEAMAGELDVAFWIPCQGTKDSVSLELVTMDKMGGSAKKAQIAHVIMSIARTVEDIEANRATIALLKNRAGKSGKVFNNVEFNNGTCRISTDHVDEFESMVSFNKNKVKETADLQAAIFKQMAKK